MVALEKARASKRSGKVRVFKKTSVPCDAKAKDEIIERQSRGEPIYLICKESHMPSLHTVYDEFERDKDFGDKFARARATAFDLLAAQCLTIADSMHEVEKSTEWHDKAGKKTGGTTTIEDALGHRRLQIETRMRLLAKWDPQRYGDRMEVGGQVNHNHEFASAFARVMQESAEDGAARKTH